MRRVAFDTVLYMLLALGLNVVVGWGGLLDLGYVAFYGIGAYSYAFLVEPVPRAPADDRPVLGDRSVGARRQAACLGFASAGSRATATWSDRHVSFFFQIFIVVVTNGDHLFGSNVTGGSNGIGRRQPRTSGPFNISAATLP